MTVTSPRSSMPLDDDRTARRDRRTLARRRQHTPDVRLPQRHRAQIDRPGRQRRPRRHLPLHQQHGRLVHHRQHVLDLEEHRPQPRHLLEAQGGRDKSHQVDVFPEVGVGEKRLRRVGDGGEDPGAGQQWLAMHERDGAAEQALGFERGLGPVEAQQVVQIESGHWALRHLAVGSPGRQIGVAPVAGSG